MLWILPENTIYREHWIQHYLQWNLTFLFYSKLVAQKQTRDTLLCPWYNVIGMVKLDQQEPITNLQVKIANQKAD